VAEPSVEAFFDVSAGERTVPGVWHENYWYRRHEACYDHVVGLVRDLRRGEHSPPRTVRVLDAGSGEGFGAVRLREAGATVVALDYDAFAMAHHAAAHPQVPGLRGNLVALPVRDGSFDVVVSLQTVEHVWDQEGFVRECVRVLRPGGTVVLSTPNRRTFPPGNLFHHRELDAAELADLLAPHVRQVTVRGLGHGPRLRAWDRDHGSLVQAQVEAPPTAWAPSLAAMVTSVVAADFAVTDDTEQALDLLAVAVTP
jgi:2-polyprenyl-3-methyl-5-hydroxy-6-metoxy-1,4-benzoquinol methylase